MLKAIIGQEAVVPEYGLGRVTRLSNEGIGVTPYIAGYEMIFDPNNVELVPISGVLDKDFRKNLMEMNVLLEFHQDIDEIMAMTLNELRKELLILRAGFEERATAIQRCHEDIDALQKKLEKTEPLLRELKKISDEYVA